VAYYFSIGFLLGLAAGLSPGPLLALVITETLQQGVQAGIKVAVAPIVTDAPIVIVMLLVAGQLSDFETVIGILSIIGSCYVLFLAYDTAKSTRPADALTRPTIQPMYKGVLTNALSPHPYLFWLTIGAPTIIKSTNVSAIAPMVFVVGFYLTLIGSKVILAWLTGKYRNILDGSRYSNLMRFLSILLGMFALLLLIDGLNLLGLYHGSL